MNQLLFADDTSLMADLSEQLKKVVTEFGRERVKGGS